MDAQENETMTRVGPGTPAGETLRRYWLPINFSDEVKTDEPKIVRRLAEDLLLFRDEFGRVGLTEPVCPHRGTSLEYGWIEGGGIRCCYHGWVYDVTGRCIEQPGEPAESTFKDKIKLKAYPTHEHGGIVWAYMGPGEPPPFPRYDFLVREDGERTLNSYLRECNFMNQLDNCLDPVHATILHGRDVNGVRQNPERAESPEFEVLADDLFASYVARRQGPEPGKEWHREVSYTPPTLVIHDGGSLPGDLERVLCRRRLAHARGRLQYAIFHTQVLSVQRRPIDVAPRAQLAEAAAAPPRYAGKIRYDNDQRPGRRGPDRPRADRQPRRGTSRLLGPRRYSSTPTLDVGDPSGHARRRAAGNPARFAR